MLEEQIRSGALVALLASLSEAQPVLKELSVRKRLRTKIVVEYKRTKHG